MLIPDNATITVQTALTEPVTFNVKDEVNAPQGAVTRFLKPKITIRIGAAVVAESKPAGEPPRAPPWGVIGLVAALLLMLFLLSR